MCNCRPEPNAPSGENNGEANQKVTREDIPTFNRFSRNALAKLPTVWQIETWPLDSPAERVIRHYLQQGRLAIEALAAEDLRVQDAASLYSLLEQTNLFLAAAGTQGEERSCIGTCTGEKQTCQDQCSTKFCGCRWNAFLCKANCFFP